LKFISGVNVKDTELLASLEATQKPFIQKKHRYNILSLHNDIGEK
jgi:hypothetical protein